MKRWLTGAVVAVLLLSACATKPEPEEAVPVETGSGWTVHTAIMTPVVTEEEKAVFARASEDSDGSFTPVAVLASQVVSGTNYAYLCLKETDASADWEIVKVYTALDGGASIEHEAVIDPSALKTTDSGIKAGLAGGWEVNPNRANAVVLEPEVNTAFAKGTESFSEAVLSPLVLLAESETTYLILAQGTRMEDASEQIYAAAVQKNSDEPAAVSILDLVSYLSE